MKVIAIASLKGGVGKTGLSVSLGNETAKNHKTLSIDLDAQASLTDFHLRDVESKQIFGKNIFHFLSGQTDLENVIYKTLFGDVIPSALNLYSIGAMTSGNPTAILEHKEEIRQQSYDFIFIDCPPSPSYEFRLGVSCADLVLVPVSKDRWSVQGLSLLLEETNKLKKAGMFQGEVMVIPSIVSEKEGELLREEIKSVKVCRQTFLKKPKIKSSLNLGKGIKEASEEERMIRDILGEVL